MGSASLQHRPRLKINDPFAWTAVAREHIATNEKRMDDFAIGRIVCDQTTRFGWCENKTGMACNLAGEADLRLKVA